MSLSRRPRPRWLAAGAAILALTASAGCAAAEPTLDERIEDLDAAIALYQSVDGAECADPGEPNVKGSSTMVLCEDGTAVGWTEEDRDEDVRELMAAMLADEGIDAVVGVNVTIMNVDTAAVAEQIGGIYI